MGEQTEQRTSIFLPFISATLRRSFLPRWAACIFAIRAASSSVPSSPSSSSMRLPFISDARARPARPRWIACIFAAAASSSAEPSRPKLAAGSS